MGLIGWQDYQNRKERKSLLNMLKSKDATDFANLELADKAKIEVKPEEPDLVPLDELDEKEYEEKVNA